jgi:hypothetical protein
MHLCLGSAMRSHQYPGTEGGGPGPEKQRIGQARVALARLFCCLLCKTTAFWSNNDAPRSITSSTNLSISGVKTKCKAGSFIR